MSGIRKKWVCFILVFIGAVFIGGKAFYFSMKQVESSRKVISAARIEPASKRLLFFYREDCPECQRLFPKVYGHNWLHHDVVFVNLNQKRNRCYIQRYHLTQVPTLICGKFRVEGENSHEIRRVLKNHRQGGTIE